MWEEQPAHRLLWPVCVGLLALSLLITVFPFGFAAQAVEVDGLLKEKMWAELEPFTVIRLKDQPNCAVDEAKIFVSFDEANAVTYIGCRMIHPKPSPVTTAEGEAAADPPVLSGLAVELEDTGLLLFSTQSAQPFDNNDYHIQGAAAALSDTGTTAELLIGQKGGLKNPLVLSLRFLDANGNSSNAYSLSIPSPVPPTTPLVVTTHGEPNSAAPKTEKPSTSRTQKETQPATQRTTQEKTTVEKTTKEKTTKEKTTKEKTTKLKTTKPKTTKIKTTKVKTTKAKTTKATLPAADSNELLQEVLAEQKSTRTALYIGVGVLLVAAFLVCFFSLKKKDE